MKQLMRRCFRVIRYALKGLILLLSIVLLLAVIGFYTLPLIITKQLPPLIAQKTGGIAHLGSSQLSLSPLFVQLNDFALQQKNGEVIAAFADVTAQINWRESIAQKTLIIDTLTLTKPQVQLAKDKNGVFNVAALLPAQTDHKTSTAPPPLLIKKLILDAGKFSYQDEKFHETLEPIHFEIENLSSDVSQPFTLLLRLSTSKGEQLDWQGKATLSPLWSQGQ
jgi:uncharacterized protein involved in outer membrane biogenesis